MKVKMICTLLFLSTLSFSSTAFSETNQNTNTTHEQKMQVKKNGEVIAWISAIDNFEINAAEVASTKNVDSAVKNYSDMLHSDHSKNLAQANQLSEQIGEKPVETKALSKFKRAGDHDLKKLSAENKNFQTSFINAMISGHADALKKVDNDLMKKVSNDQLKTLLQETRAMIAHHLETAKEIKKNMVASS